jgi:lysophospholipase L1-like esterase
MKRNRIAGTCLVIATGLLLAAMDTYAAARRPRVERLRRMVVVGDSLLAGFISGGFVARDQRRSAPALLARRAGVKLSQPLMSGAGVPPPLRIDDRDGDGRLDAAEVRRGSLNVGFRKYPGGRVRNLAVPGEDITSVFERVDLEDVAASGDGRDILKFLILGVPLRDDSVSQLTRAEDLDPGFLLVWLGSNDVLTMATKTNPARAGLTPAQFGAEFRRLLARLADSGAGMAVANLPDVTQIAALRGPGTEVTGCIGAGGVVVPAAPDWLVRLDLDTAELPEPPCSNVLDAAERAEVRATVTAFNAEIAAAVAAVEANRGVTVANVDMFALFDDVATNGYDVHGDGSLVLTTEYLGGIFSLDGIHPTRTAHALIANAFIDAINTRFGEAIPPVDVGRAARRDKLVRNAYRPEGEPPFGLIAGVDTELDDALDEALDDVGDSLDEIIDDLEDFFDDIFDF